MAEHDTNDEHDDAPGAGDETQPLICHRCGALLHPGRGDFYVVRIEAYADPTPPNLDEIDADADLAGEIESLIEQMRDRSSRELLDEVFRRMTLHLCTACYRRWIEAPTG